MAKSQKQSQPVQPVSVNVGAEPVQPVDPASAPPEAPVPNYVDSGPVSLTLKASPPVDEGEKSPPADAPPADNDAAFVLRVFGEKYPERFFSNGQLDREDLARSVNQYRHLYARRVMTGGSE